MYTINVHTHHADAARQPKKQAPVSKKPKESSSEDESDSSEEEKDSVKVQVSRSEHAWQYAPQ